MVKIEFEKRDVFWVSFIIVLVGVGFVYGYNTNPLAGDPSKMGHSWREVMPTSCGEFDFVMGNGKCYDAKDIVEWGTLVACGYTPGDIDEGIEGQIKKGEFLAGNGECLDALEIYNVGKFFAGDLDTINSLKNCPCGTCWNMKLDTGGCDCGGGVKSFCVPSGWVVIKDDCDESSCYG